MIPFLPPRGHRARLRRHPIYNALFDACRRAGTRLELTQHAILDNAGDYMGATHPELSVLDRDRTIGVTCETIPQAAAGLALALSEHAHNTRLAAAAQRIVSEYRITRV